jgi:NAD+ kinase
MSRNVALDVHWGRFAAITTATKLVSLLATAGINVIGISHPDAKSIANLNFQDASDLDTCEAILVVGGDGTILRGAEIARTQQIPLLGINLGHVGFLAVAEPDALDVVVLAIVNRSWVLDPRLSLEVKVEFNNEIIWTSWALNEISIEKAAEERIVELVTAIDDRPVSRYAGDGVVVATPTGSTAYAFSAGGPIVWPNVAAFVLVPLSAHALFARPLVISPDSSVQIELMSKASAWADSRRGMELPAGSRITITRSEQPVLLARMNAEPFTDRLVAKFDLPTNGWRGSAGSVN